MYAVVVRLHVAAGAAALVALLAVPTSSHAQSAGPIAPFVFDLRGFYPGLGQDPITAKQLNVDQLQLPSRGLGGIAGISVYPIRVRRFAFGLGGEGMLARGKAQEENDEGQPVGLAVRQVLKGLSGNVSLNFGDNNGWSYVTGGMGPMTFKSYLGETSPLDPAPNKMTINMGGGARWFVNDHVALTFDVRFYLLRPEETTGSFPGRQRYRLLALSGGIGIK